MSAKTRKLVLIADDDERVLIDLEAVLEDEGYDTTTAWSGRQALELLRSKEFDLVLLDDDLSDIGTEEVLKDIRRMEAQPLTVLMQSSQRSPDPLPGSASLGVCQVVNKRMPRRQLSDVVRAWLSRVALSIPPSGWD